MMQTIPQGAEVFFADPFESLVRSVINPKTVATPAMDWSMDARAYYLDLDVPGMAREDLTIQTLDRQVRVRGERKVATPEGRTLLRRERPSGTWEHTWTVPKDARVEEISAELHDGVLSLTIPKNEKAEPRTIAIAGEAQKALPEN